MERKVQRIKRALLDGAQNAASGIYDRNINTTKTVIIGVRRNIRRSENYHNASDPY